MIVTLADVARRAGVAPATAARALGAYGYVSEATRIRVEAAADELQYRTNTVARALASGSTRAIGLIVTDIENPFFATAARAISDITTQAGYVLLLANSDEDSNREREALKTFAERLVDAIILVPASSKEANHLHTASRRHSIVLFDRKVRGLEVDSVTVAHEAGATAALRHLVGLGHRHIAVLADSLEIPSTVQRLRGYRRGLREAGIAIDERLIAIAGNSIDRAREATTRLLTRRPRFSAVFTAGNLMTAGAVMAFRDHGVRMPGDIALVGFDDLEWSTFVDPSITVVAQPVIELGNTAGRLVLERLAGSAAPPVRIRLSTRLIVRGSCGAQPPTGQIGQSTPTGIRHD